MIDTMRVRNILVSPDTEWQKVATEADSIKGVFGNYLSWLLGLVAIVAFINMSVFGVDTGSGEIRFGVFTSLTQALISAGGALLGIYLISLLANALAPRFGGTRNSTNAFKLVVYASTASILGSAVSFLPWIGGLIAMFAGLYSAYLIYKGLPVLMQTPKDKALRHTVILILGSFVLSIFVGMIMLLLSPLI